MPKIRLEVSKLENATADYISLVSRGANRIPFRIIKQHTGQENDMINLGGKLDLADIRNVIKSDGKSKGSAAVHKDDSVPQAKLAAIVVEKGDHITPEFKLELAAAGVATDNPVEANDNTISFTQGDIEATTVAKMNGNTLALLSDLDAEAVVKGTYLEPVYEEMGFLPSIDEAKEGLQLSIAKALGEGKPEEMAETTKKIEALTGECNVYVHRLMQALPESVFKGAAVVAKACSKLLKGQAAVDGVPAKKGDAAVTVEKVDCPACAGKKCAACGDMGKITKAEAETLKKAFPMKKPPMAADAEDAGDNGVDDATESPAAAAATAPVPKPPKAKPKAMPAASGNNAGGDGDAEDNGPGGDGGADEATEAPDGVDAKAWAAMSPAEKAKVQAAAQKSDKSQEGGASVTMQPMDANVQKSLDALLSAVGTIQKSVADLTGAVANVTKAQSDLATEVAGVKATAVKAEATARGTIIGGVPPADREAQQPIKKSDGLGNFDTAFTPQVRRVTKYADRVAASNARR